MLQITFLNQELFLLKFIFHRLKKSKKKKILIDMIEQKFY